MSTTQELLAANERYVILRERIRAYAEGLAGVDYRGPRPAEHYVSRRLLDILESA